MQPLSAKTRDAIRTRRIELGLSQPKAAEAAGVSITTWNGAERGRSNPQPLQRAAMSRLLGWSDDSIERLEAGKKPVEATPRATLPAVDPDGVVSDEFVRAVARLTERLESVERLVHQLATDALGRRAG